ncbi:unnamed protein product [Cylindrotheca closterium]|uniref:Uncharacterized protein n=1 Tax=Cylindrotheca closterium TaxID=2856 RepID=A0AAD2FDN8_9STRA|nr:unnamed protein product [Cylindrotheca closterium]
MAAFFNAHQILLFIGTTIVLSNFLIASRLPSHELSGGVRLLRESQEQTDVGLFSEKDESEEEKAMLHIVTTRFMQSQAGLTKLGKARLKLFETFCLPSMQTQVIDNFLWFVMIDPNLEGELLERLQFLLAPHPNFFLVLSNEKLLTPHNLMNKQEVVQIVSGETQLLYSRMMDVNRPLLMETRLDADDGLHRKTLGQIQYAAMKLPQATGGWQVICADVHLEWRNDEIANLNSTVESSGRIRLVKEDICVTPGYTLVRHREPGSNEFPPWPKMGHQQMNTLWPECLSSNSTKEGEPVNLNCWTRLPKYPAALRSRTITSAGMSRVRSSAKDRIYDEQTNDLWQHVTRDFGIGEERTLLTSQYLQNNIHGIAVDNLLGQCTRGHSCKRSSRDKLEALAKETASFR